MRALLFSAPSPTQERSELRDVAVPAPGPGQVTIDVEFAGVNFVDVMARRGDAGYVSAWPYVPGKEVAGTVRELGSGVTGLRAGERVAALLPGGGGFAEVAVCARALTASVPDALALSAAATAPLLVATGALLMELASFRAGQTVLTHSASGGVGAVLASLVKAQGGGTCIGTVGPTRPASADGYDVVLPRDEHLVEHVLKAVPQGVDVIFDPLGTTMLNSDLELARTGAHVVLFGNAEGFPLGPLPRLPELMRKNLTLSGFSITSLAALAPARYGQALTRALDLLDAGTVVLSTHEVDLATGSSQALQRLADRSSTGKAVVRVAG